MKYAPVLTTPPATTPVSVDEAKAHLRVDHGDEDALIASYVAAATAHLDGYTGVLGRAIVMQTWRQDFDDFYRCMRLPLVAAAVSSVTYRESDGTEQTVDAESYELLADARGSFVRFLDGFSFPGDLAEAGAVSITFTAGYADVPAAIQAAVLLMVGHFYRNREAVNVGNIVTPLPMGVDALIAPYRRVGF